MARHVFLGEAAPTVGEDLTVVTPNENAAATLGARHLSLESMARLSLTEGKRAANPVRVSRLLRAAVERELGAADAAGVAHTLLRPHRPPRPGVLAGEEGEKPLGSVFLQRATPQVPPCVAHFVARFAQERPN